MPSSRARSGCAWRLPAPAPSICLTASGAQRPGRRLPAGGGSGQPVQGRGARLRPYGDVASAGAPYGGPRHAHRHGAARRDVPDLSQRRARPGGRRSAASPAWHGTHGHRPDVARCRAPRRGAG
ncbi:hypothetical protein G6F66_015115 [Rhizopus arrhizus]|nr:hypothetical protein G6F68_019193 [Rhizopus microsporus]KAG1253385.1 hypothetical protein G6F66_015115 [Rhizopus arrhizus]